MTHVRALWGMARPLIMVSVLLVYALGALMARAYGSPFDALAFLWGLAALVPVALSTHYVNEFADVETDRLTVRTPFSGGSGVLAEGLASPNLALVAGWASLAAGLAIALAGTAAGALNASALLLLAIGAFGGWMYSLPPLRLAWNGWGEAANAALGGLILPLYGFATQTGRADPLALLACLPFTLLVFNNLLATTWADRQADAQVGKRTLATRLSPRTLRQIYVGCAVCCFALLIALAGHALPVPVALGSMAALPLVVWGARHFAKAESPHPTVIAMVALLLLHLLLWFFEGN